MEILRIRIGNGSNTGCIIVYNYLQRVNNNGLEKTHAGYQNSIINIYLDFEF